MGLSNAERQRRFIARLKIAAKAGDRSKATIAALKMRITELEAECQRLKAQSRTAAGS